MHLTIVIAALLFVAVSPFMSAPPSSGDQVSQEDSDHAETDADADRR